MIDSKSIHLQKFIDIFELQAHGFLLHHGSMNDMPLQSLADYDEYDHVDDMDNSRVTGPAPQILHPPDGESPSSEDIPILLPSTLGWQWCARNGIKTLALKEARLQYAPATDSIHLIRLALQFKSTVF